MDFVDARVIEQMRSREELRFEFVDEQKWDSSCGFAAMASLLSRYRGAAVTESDLIGRAAPQGGKVEAKVTLAELARVVTALGFEVRPWRAGYDALAAMLPSAPLLVHYNKPDGHFALVLAAGPNGVVTADPARGLELLSKAQFLGRWSGIAVEVLDPRDPDSGNDIVEKAVRSAFARQSLVERALSKPPPKR